MPEDELADARDLQELRDQVASVHEAVREHLPDRTGGGPGEAPAGSPEWALSVQQYTGEALERLEEELRERERDRGEDGDRSG